MSLYDYLMDPPSELDPYGIEFISFGGASVNGITYVGVMKSLEERQIRQKVKYWSGTSAGAIVAALGALGADSHFIFKCLSETDMTMFLDYGGRSPDSTWWNKLRTYYSATELFTKLGVARGSHFSRWIRECIVKLGYPEDLTFSQLYDRTGNHLITVAACLNIFDALYLGRASYPNMTVADAIHVSMIIPFVFQPVIMKDPLLPMARMMLDGGIVSNYPLNVFDPQTPSGRLLGINRKAIGFFTISNGLWGNESESITNFMKFSQSVLEIMFRQQERIQTHQPYFWERSVPIDIYGHSPMDFNMTPEWINRLVNSGYSSCEYFLENRFKMISEKGSLPDNLFIPIVQHSRPLGEEENWVDLSTLINTDKKVPGWSAGYWPLTNDNLRDTLVYQTNPDIRRIRNIVGM